MSPESCWVKSSSSSARNRWSSSSPSTIRTSSARNSSSRSLCFSTNSLSSLLLSITTPELSMARFKDRKTLPYLNLLAYTRLQDRGCLHAGLRVRRRLGWPTVQREEAFDPRQPLLSRFGMLPELHAQRGALHIDPHVGQHELRYEDRRPLEVRRDGLELA